jgi:hypothetical protein
LPANSLVLTRRGVDVPDLGSTLEIVAPNEVTTPSRSRSLLLVDEARDVPRATFAALMPSVVGAGTKTIIASSAGPPRGWFYDLVQIPSPGSWVYQSSINNNPHADRHVLDFLKRRLALLAPSAARRELHNEFVDDADTFLSTALVDAAIDDHLTGACPEFVIVDEAHKLRRRYLGCPNLFESGSQLLTFWVSETARIRFTDQHRGLFPRRYDRSVSPLFGRAARPEVFRFVLSLLMVSSQNWQSSIRPGRSLTRCEVWPSSKAGVHSPQISGYNCLGSSRSRSDNRLDGG